MGKVKRRVIGKDSDENIYISDIDGVSVVNKDLDDLGESVLDEDYLKKNISIKKIVAESKGKRSATRESTGRKLRVNVLFNPYLHERYVKFCKKIKMNLSQRIEALITNDEEFIEWNS